MHAVAFTLQLRLAAISAVAISLGSGGIMTITSSKWMLQKQPPPKRKLRRLPPRLRQPHRSLKPQSPQQHRPRMRLPYRHPPRHPPQSLRLPRLLDTSGQIRGGAIRAAAAGDTRDRQTTTAASREAAVFSSSRRLASRHPTRRLPRSDGGGGARRDHPRRDLTASDRHRLSTSPSR